MYLHSHSVTINLVLHALLVSCHCVLPSHACWLCLNIPRLSPLNKASCKLLIFGGSNSNLSYSPCKYFRPSDKWLWCDSSGEWKVRSWTLCYWCFSFLFWSFWLFRPRLCVYVDFHVSVAEAQPSGKTWLWCEWSTRTESTPFFRWSRLGSGSFCQCLHLVTHWHHDLHAFQTCCFWPL